MKCDQCGCQFPGREARHDTRCETGYRSRIKSSSEPIVITLCPACASSRIGTYRLFNFLGWLIVGVLCAGAVIVCSFLWSLLM